MTQPRDQVERHQAAGNLHHRQHHRHVGIVENVNRAQHAQAGYKRACRVRTVVSRHRRLVDPPHPGHCREAKISKDTDQAVGDEPDRHEPDHAAQNLRVQRGEFFAAMPADGDQKIDGERLVDGIGKLELDLQNGDQEPQVEEEQKGLEQVVRKVMPELREDALVRLAGKAVGRCLHGRIDHGNMHSGLECDEFHRLVFLGAQRRVGRQFQGEAVRLAFLIQGNLLALDIDRLDCSLVLGGLCTQAEADRQQKRGGAGPNQSVTVCHGRDNPQRKRNDLKNEDNARCTVR